MTAEQKEILISRMLDTPSSLSDEELDLILRDKELREIYDVSASVSSAYFADIDIDASAEWEKFRPRLRSEHSFISVIVKIAAVFIAVFIVGGIVFKVVNSHKVDVPATKTVVISHANTSKSTYPLKSTYQLSTETHDSIMNKDVTKISTVMAIKKDYPSASPLINKATTITPDEEIYVPDEDIEQYLRSQQAGIENELAIQTAEALADNLNMIELACEMAGVNDIGIDNAIYRVSMQ